MATSNPSSSDITTSLIPPTNNQNSSLKLDNNNYLMWLTQVLPILYTHDLMGIVDGSESCPHRIITNDEGKETPNPEFNIWNKKDQYILSIITASLTEKVLATVYGLNASRQAWTALATKFASQSKSRTTHLKQQLQNLTQGPKSCSDYLQLAKQTADQLTAAGKPIDDEDLIAFIINGLNPSFTSFITTYSFATRESTLSFEDFQDQLLSHEMLLNQQQQEATDSSSFALTAQRPMVPQFSKGRAPQFSKFPSRNFNQRPANGYPTPRPQYQQYNRGPQQYNRDNSSFSNQQYRQQCSKGNSFSKRSYHTSENYWTSNYQCV
jgi:hypothetical protein